MFFNAPGNPTMFKQAVYLIAATILGMLVIFIVNKIIEINYLSLALSQGGEIVTFNDGTLPPAFSFELLLLGAIIGFFLGRFWWRQVYIDKIWAKKHGGKK